MPVELLQMPSLFKVWGKFTRTISTRPERIVTTQTRGILKMCLVSSRPGRKGCWTTENKHSSALPRRPCPVLAEGSVGKAFWLSH